MNLFHYHLFYYSLIFFFFIIYILSKKIGIKYRSFDIIFIFILSFVIGLRSKEIGSDTITYVNYYDEYAKESYDKIINNFKQIGSDMIIYLIFKICSIFNSYRIALLVVCFLTNIFFYKFIVNISKLIKVDTTILFLVFMASFTVFSMETNIIRSGLGMAFMLNFAYYFFVRQPKKYIVYGILAIFSHFSMLIAIAMFIVVRLFDFGNKKLIFLFIVSIGLALIGFGVLNLISYLGNIELRQLQTYTTFADQNYQTGFRLSFVTYNSFFLFVFYKYRIDSKFYKYFLQFFIYSSSLFFLWFALPYSDRMGAFSWTVIPVILFCCYKNIRLRFNRKLVSINANIVFLFYFLISYGLSVTHT